MNKRKAYLLTTVALIVALASVYIVYALTSYTFNQNLTVKGDAIEVYYGTSQLEDAKNLTNHWTWETDHFVLTLTIKNTGTNAIVTTVTAETVTGWTFSKSGTGALDAGAEQAVTLTMTPSDSTPGTSTGSFTFTISAT